MYSRNFLKCFLLSLVLTACATTDPGLAISTYWIPQKVAFTPDRYWVEEGGVVVRQEVRPEKVAIVSSEAASAIVPLKPFKNPFPKTGSIPLHKARLKSGEEIYCFPFSSFDKSAAMKFLWGDSQQNMCFKDSNADGHFDQMFNFTTPSYGLPIVMGSLTKEPRNIRPMSYELSANTPLAKLFYIETHLDRIAGSDFSKLHFKTLSSADGADTTSLTTGRVVREITQTPSTVSLDGVTVEILEIEKDRVKVRAIAARPQKPFTLMVFKTYRYY